MTIPTATLLCALALTHWPSHYAGDDAPARLQTCTQVVIAAQTEGVDPYLAVTLVHYETRHRAKPRRTYPPRINGCCWGPWQVHAGYYCPDGTVMGCDLISTGAAVLARRLAQREPRLALCAWFRGSSAPCDDVVLNRADAILRTARVLRERRDAVGW